MIEPDAPPAENALGPALTRMGLLPSGGSFSASRLSGGISCDVWKVERPGAPVLVVKQPLAKLKVAVTWNAPPERWAAEAAWLTLAGTIDPDTAPNVLGTDKQAGMIAMAFLENCPLWKKELAAGRADTGFARRTGQKLAAIHAGTANRPDIARQFDNGVQFHALRLEPYLLFTAQKNPDVAEQIKTIADDIAAARIALMHGDISPKNILMTERGPVFLDAETACYGDPAFDLAFCLNHLLLKCVWHPEHMQSYLASFQALTDGYRAGIDWENPATLETRAARQLAALLLARIDGKSPVEYITAEADKVFVREIAKDLFKNGEGRLNTIADAWKGRAGAIPAR